MPQPVPEEEIGLCQGVQLSLQGSQVSQEVQASERGYTQEGELGQGQGRQRQVLKVPQKVDLHHPCTSAVHHLRVTCTRSGTDHIQELLFLVIAFNHFSPLSIFHYSCIFL